MALLPPSISSAFPVIVTHKNAMSQELADKICHTGATAQSFKDLADELRSIRAVQHDRLRAKYCQHVLEMDLNVLPGGQTTLNLDDLNNAPLHVQQERRKATYPMLNFSEQKRDLTASFLRQVYVKLTQQQLAIMRAQRATVVGPIWAGDATFKAAKYSGVGSHCLFGAHCNSTGEIGFIQHCPTKSQSEIRDALRALHIRHMARTEAEFKRLQAVLKALGATAEHGVNFGSLTSHPFVAIRYTLSLAREGGLVDYEGKLDDNTFILLLAEFDFPSGLAQFVTSPILCWYTDMCCEDRACLLETIPSLTATLLQSELESYFPQQSPVQYLTLSDLDKDPWLTALDSLKMEPFLGLDCEWRCFLVKGKLRSPVSVLSIAAPSQTYVFHFPFVTKEDWTSVPQLQALKTFLETTPSQTQYLVGHNWRGSDCKNLQADFGLDTTRVMNLLDLVSSSTPLTNPATGKVEKSRCLESVVSALTGKVHTKARSITKTNWDSDLTDTQKAYAAYDAHLCLLGTLAVRKKEALSPTTRPLLPVYSHSDVDGIEILEQTPAGGVKQDIVHLLWRFREAMTSQNHEKAGAFSSLISRAFYQHDTGDYEAVVSYLVSKKNLSERDAKSAAFSDSYFQHIRRSTKPIANIIEGLKATVATFRGEMGLDSAGKPLFKPGDILDKT